MKDKFIFFPARGEHGLWAAALELTSPSTSELIARMAAESAAFGLKFAGKLNRVLFSANALSYYWFHDSSEEEEFLKRVFEEEDQTAWEPRLVEMDYDELPNEPSECVSIQKTELVCFSNCFALLAEVDLNTSPSRIFRSSGVCTVPALFELIPGWSGMVESATPKLSPELQQELELVVKILEQLMASQAIPGWLAAPRLEWGGKSAAVLLGEGRSSEVGQYIRDSLVAPKVSV